MTIGERIKQRRIELDMSQDELAKKVGYKSRSSIQKIESARNLPITKVEIMANALDTTPSDLMGWKNVVEELKRQTKPLSDFWDTHEVNPEVKALFDKYSAKDIRRVSKFIDAFLKATPERQKIALEILQQSHQDKP